MEASRYTDLNDMDLDDLIFMDHLQFDELFEPSIFLETRENVSMAVFEQQTSEEQGVMCKIYAQADVQTTIEENPLKNENWNISCNNTIKNHALSLQEEKETFASSIMLSFDNPSNKCSQNRGIHSDYHQASKKPSAMASLSSQQAAKDHILAERRRREKLNQRFIALSTIIPGLKKVDKATVLTNAYKYVKQLEEEVKTLEEATKTKTIETAMLVNQSIEDESSRFFVDGQCPEIEAKFSDKDVLIRIHCETKYRVVEKLISHIENLHLAVVNSNALVFGSASLDATIIAQMGDEFSMTAKDLVRNLHIALRQLL